MKYIELSDDAGGETSSVIKERVNRARENQKKRFKGKGIYSNSQMSPSMVRKQSKPDTEGLNY